MMNDKVATAAKSAYGVSLDFNPLHYYGWTKRYLELFEEGQESERNSDTRSSNPS